jgi:OOP family OmpA-OmpF porin
MKKNVVILLVAIAAFSTARPFTTKQMRNDTIRINALEVEFVEETPAVKQNNNREVTKIIRLNENKLYFDFDESRVKPEYYSVIREMVKEIKDGDSDVIIRGYTDSKGTDEYNNSLSLRRAEAVRAKLVEFGLEPGRIIKTEGMGKQNPVAPNTNKNGSDNPAGRALNRRIELELVK